MKYKDLVQFEPVETVIQLRDADKLSEAKTLVSTFVVSEKMADRLSGMVIPQLQYEKISDNRGLLITGNYGTGKSHLMSFISSVAEHEELAAQIRNEAVRKAVKPIAGRFKVLRTELGSTTMDFRQFVVTQIEDALDEWGINYKFPAQDKIANHKGAFEDMMKAFHAKFPDLGFLMVVDELLDYLRTRRDEQLLMDLGFLREIGEVCKNLRFRFIAGLQEMLFDNPKFAFVAEPLRRVRDRFEQILIERGDVEFVVQERLLHKSAEQLGRVEEHLKSFCRYYGDLSPQLERYTAMFPVHPQYVSIFERLAIGEKREVLKSLTGVIRGILEEPVPKDSPGIFSFDRYWELLCANPALRSLSDDIKRVVDTSKTLEDIVARNIKPKSYLPMAKRLIHALSIHRLTTGDIRRPVGLTAEALRDQLCLFDPTVTELGGEPAEDLLSHVETVLKTLLRTVSGQFLTYNKNNGEYFLDVEKTEDYDAQIEKRADALGPNQKNRAYHAALTVALEKADQPTYISGARIWLHELEWREHKSGRSGYLFFGAPNERTTAQPPRDFYLYFIQPFDPPKYRDEKLSDEVFFKVPNVDRDFDQLCSNYAAALDLVTTASGDAKTQYEKKAEIYLGQLANWLSKNVTTAFVVTHEGSTKKLAEWMKGVPPSTLSKTINQVGSACLASQFNKVAPEYPVFSLSVTRGTRGQAALEAIRTIRGNKTQLGAAVLEALELLDGSEIAIAKSKYAQHVLKLLQGKASGQVVNRGEIITTIAETFEKIEYMDPDGMRLEPEFVAVLLAAMVYNGDAVLAVVGDKFDSGKFDQLVNTPLETLTTFRHIERPKDWDVPSLRELFKLLNLPPGQVQLAQQNKDDVIKSMQSRATELVNKLVQSLQAVSNGFHFWGQPLKSPEELEKMRAELQKTKDFLEGLQSYNTTGKLKNFKASPDEVKAQQSGLETRADVEQLETLISGLSDYATYLSQAEMALPDKHHWKATVENTKKVVLGDIRDAKKRAQPDFARKIRQQLDELKQTYITEYRSMHERARLSSSDDQKKAKLIHDPRLQALRALSTIEHLPTHQRESLEGQFDKLRTCFALTEKDMKATPLCPHCSFDPSRIDLSGPSSAMMISKLDADLDQMTADWTKQLVEMVDDPITQKKLDLLPKKRRDVVKQFLNTKALPGTVDADFVRSIQEALSDLSRVPVSMDDLRKALSPDAAALKVDELRSRFEQFLASKTKGKEPDKVRIVIE